MDMKTVEALLQEYDKENRIHKTIVALGINHGGSGLNTYCGVGALAALSSKVKEMEYFML